MKPQRIIRLSTSLKRNQGWYLNYIIGPLRNEFCKILRKIVNSEKATYRPSIHLTQSDKETYVYQDKLPKQPISSLSNTGTKLKRTLDALETHPSFGTEQIERLKNLWDEFAENEGLKIDEILRINDSKQRDSFVHELWTTMYLADRVPILMNYNPSIAMTPPDPTLSQAQVGFIQGFRGRLISMNRLETRQSNQHWCLHALQSIIVP